MIITTIDRFWDKVLIDEGCWLWTAGVASHGYGQFGIGAKKWTTAHRYSWEFFNGPIPKGMFVCHMCDVKRCVRPSHLFLGTCRDNVADAVAKGRNYIPARTIGVIEAMRVQDMYASGMLHREIAKIFGVSRATIGRTLQRYKHH